MPAKRKAQEDTHQQVARRRSQQAYRERHHDRLNQEAKARAACARMTLKTAPDHIQQQKHADKLKSAQRYREKSVWIIKK
ncbi:hypothetical protein H0H93_008165 [Arthromyces matolae]|nr:hypothetical protein H0H93_008165 [Arthromyces matolae]